MTLKLAQAYVQSSHSRNLLSKAAVQYLLDDRRLPLECQALQLSLGSIGVALELLPLPVLRPAKITVQGDMCAIRSTTTLLVSTDGVPSGDLHGCRVVLRDPTSGKEVIASMSYVALDSAATVPELVARLLATWLLGSWRGSRPP